jgi:flagellar basal body-associated protein FliL
MAFCQNCGTQLSAGMQVCPRCGASVYNTGGSGIASSASIPPSIAGETAPTVFSTPPPPPPDYAGRDQSGPYAPPVPTNYGTPPYASFGAPPQPYSAPQSGAYLVQPQSGEYGMPPQQPKKSRAGLIIGIVVAVVLLIGIGVVVAIFATSNHKNTAHTGTPTATGSTPTSAPTTAPTSTPTTPANSSPSGNPIDPTAASIITNPVMASAVDSNDQPTNVTNTFQTNQKIWVTFGLNLQGSTGYVEAKWYINDQLYVTRNFAANNPAFTSGYFWQEYTASGQGAVELYWCTQSNCSDAALAAYTTFTVSGSSYHSGGQMPFAFAMAMWRRD